MGRNWCFDEQNMKFGIQLLTWWEQIWEYYHPPFSFRNLIVHPYLGNVYGTWETFYGFKNLLYLRSQLALRNIIVLYQSHEINFCISQIMNSTPIWGIFLALGRCFIDWWRTTASTSRNKWFHFPTHDFHLYLGNVYSTWKMFYGFKNLLYLRS